MTQEKFYAMLADFDNCSRQDEYTAMGKIFAEVFGHIAINELDHTELAVRGKLPKGAFTRHGDPDGYVEFVGYAIDSWPTPEMQVSGETIRLIVAEFDMPYLPKAPGVLAFCEDGVAAFTIQPGEDGYFGEMDGLGDTVDEMFTVLMNHARRVTRYAEYEMLPEKNFAMV